MKIYWLEIFKLLYTIHYILYLWFCSLSDTKKGVEYIFIFYVIAFFISDVIESIVYSFRYTFIHVFLHIIYIIYMVCSYNKLAILYYNVILLLFIIVDIFIVVIYQKIR